MNDDLKKWTEEQESLASDPDSEGKKVVSRSTQGEAMSRTFKSSIKCDKCDKWTMIRTFKNIWKCTECGYVLK